MPTLRELLIASAIRGAEQQSPDGCMPPGHNGPRGDRETPARNTAHWTVLFIRAYQWSGQQLFRSAAERACRYLISSSALPMSGAFWCRLNPQKDFSNGLIGQAWVMEALALGTEALNWPELGFTAQTVFKRHSYVMDRHLWRNLNVDGSYGPLNDTFNQQLWFATTGLALCRLNGQDQQIAEQVDDFFAHYHLNLRLRNDGLIVHRVRSTQGMRTKARELRNRLIRRTDRQLILSVGYHSFNLYGLTLAHEMGGLPRNRRVLDAEMRRALRFANTPGYKRLLQGNPFAYAYNPTGIEVAYAISVFKETCRQWMEDPMREAMQWLETQLARHFSCQSRLMDRNTPDSTTLAARLYEATRLPDLAVRIDTPK
jgi:hypothetical protein